MATLNLIKFPLFPIPSSFFHFFFFQNDEKEKCLSPPVKNSSFLKCKINKSTYRPCSKCVKFQFSSVFFRFSDQSISIIYSNSVASSHNGKKWKSKLRQLFSYPLAHNVLLLCFAMCSIRNPVRFFYLFNFFLPSISFIHSSKRKKQFWES